MGLISEFLLELRALQRDAQARSRIGRVTLPSWRLPNHPDRYTPAAQHYSEGVRGGQTLDVAHTLVSVAMLQAPPVPALAAPTPAREGVVAATVIDIAALRSSFAPRPRR